METFEEKVDRYMQCDKRTLAELLAMRDLADSKELQNPYDFRPIEPYWIGLDFVKTRKTKK